jgi:hypothetical protein
MKSKIEIALGLKHTEIEQIKSYIRWAEESGVYWGPKDQFDKRHKHIKEVFEMEE